MATKKNQISLDMNQLEESEIDLLLDGLDQLEHKPMENPFELGDPMAGFLMATSREDAQQQLEEKMRNAKIEIRDRKRRIVLLKAKLIMASMNRLSELFTVKNEQPTA